MPVVFSRIRVADSGSPEIPDGGGLRRPPGRSRARGPRGGSETSSSLGGNLSPFWGDLSSFSGGGLVFLRGTSHLLGRPRFIWGDPSSYMDEPPSFWGEASSS